MALPSLGVHSPPSDLSHVLSLSYIAHVWPWEGGFLRAVFTSFIAPSQQLDIEQEGIEEAHKGSDGPLGCEILSDGLTAQSKGRMEWPFRSWDPGCLLEVSSLS